MKRGLLWFFGAMLALTACASETHLPYRSWHLSFSDVPHMEVWVEDAQVVDVTGRRFGRLSPGILSDGNDGETSPAGWASSSGDGKGQDVTGAALPERIYVRWQSLAEPQTYQATVVIPDPVRKLMLTQGPNKPEFKHPVPGAYYYNRINLGLAPGGWIKVWAGGILAKPIPVLCIKAEVDPIGPYGGKSGGKYRPLTKKAADYLVTHPIPYDSWKCDAH